MTDYVQTGLNSSISGSFNFISGDTLFVMASGSIVLSASNSVLGCAPGAISVSMTLNGTVNVASFSLEGQSSLFIGSTGTLTAHGATSAVNLSIGGGSGLSTVFNQGTILVEHAFGMALFGGQNQIINAGMIFGDNTGVSLGLDKSAADALTNTGTIVSSKFQAVEMIGGLAHVANSGSILAVNGVAFVVSGEWNGSASVATAQWIDNSGTIAAPKAVAISVSMTVAESIFTLHNSGLIHALSVAIDAGNELDQIFNTGTLDGTVSLAGGDDIFDTRGGIVNGSVDLGAGGDTFVGTGATVNGTVAGGAGSDTYITDDANLSIFEDVDIGAIDTVYAAVSFRLAANVEALTLTGTSDFNGFGNSGANTLIGNAGDNRLLGLGGNDTINGDLGNDRIFGGTLNDTLAGDDGEDTLSGNAGNDALNGGDGDDVLNGGLGKDKLTGAEGSDSFVFTALAQSGATKASADLITDFTQGDDHIDLSGIDANRGNVKPDDAFTFLGTAAFGHVAGQLRYVQSAGNTLVSMDVDGDGVADCMVVLTGTLALTAGDFVL